MLLDSIDNGSGSVSLVWFAGVTFSIAMILLGMVWRQHVAQQKEALEEQKKQTIVIQGLALDIAVMKNNSNTTTNDVKAIRNDMEDVRHEITLIDKRVYKLEVAK